MKCMFRMTLIAGLAITLSGCNLEEIVKGAIEDAKEDIKEELKEEMKQEAQEKRRLWA